MVSVGLLCLFFSEQQTEKLSNVFFSLPTHPFMHALFIVKTTTVWFCSWKLNYRSLCGPVWLNLWKLPASTHTAAAWKTAQSTKTLWPASRVSSPCHLPCHLPSDWIRCHPQEFSDEEEDIDALMSAHSKITSRRLSNAVSTVTPVLDHSQNQIVIGVPMWSNRYTIMLRMHTYRVLTARCVTQMCAF